MSKRRIRYFIEKFRDFYGIRHIFHKILYLTLSNLNTVYTLTAYSSLILLLTYSVLCAQMSEMASYRHVIPASIL